MGIGVFDTGLSIFRDVDDTPVDGETSIAVSSNWAYDHAINYLLHTKMAYKAADETVNNSNTLQNDDDLKLVVAANEIWTLELRLIFKSVSTTSDYLWGFSYPTGCGIYWGWDALWLAVATTSGPNTCLIQTDTIARGSGNLSTPVWIKVIIINGATAGTVNFQWAQNTATVEDTDLLAGSCMIAHRLV